MNHRFTKKTNTQIVIALFVLCGFIILSGMNCKKNDAPDNTAQTDKDSISFIVLGDFGMDGNENQKPVAQQMIKYGRQYHVQFVVTVGDNFYPSGVASTTDAHWQTSFENIYNKDSLPVIWYPSLGNHDYETAPQAEVQYTATSNRWYLPARYYSIKKNIDASHTVLLAFTDTSPFVNAYYTASPVMPDIKQQDTAAQLQWLNQTLTASNDTWKLAIGHHPVYSVGLHGNTQELIQRFQPIFAKTNTDFYLCGHDHDLQYIQPNETTHYLISGGGSEKTPVVSGANVVFAQPSSGFLIMTLYPRKANIYFYNEQGLLLYQKQFNK